MIYSPGGASPCDQHCDNIVENFIAGWYRFALPGGGTRLPTEAPESFGIICDVCQTNAAAWVKEQRNPQPDEGIIDVTLCLAWSGNECIRETTAQIVACHEDDGSIFHLYNLNSTSSCNYAYCAI